MADAWSCRRRCLKMTMKHMSAVVEKEAELAFEFKFEFIYVL
jgi:hypothetical protein